jgi:hypothetical protein
MFHIDCGEPELALQRLDVAEALVAEQRLAAMTYRGEPETRLAPWFGADRQPYCTPAGRLI